MPISLDGTQGINNDATDLNYTGTLTGGTGVVNLGSGQVFKDASGNVGIGVSSPLGRLHSAGGVFVTGLDSPADGGAAGSFQMGYSGGNGVLRTFASSPIRFDTAGVERMRIDSSGNLLVGRTTDSGNDNLAGALINSLGSFVSQRVDSANLLLNRIGSNGDCALFRRQGSNVGSISVTTTNTTYNTSSDYRLKHDIQPMTGALAKVAALKPCTYKWNADDSNGEGFIAHELQEVCPDAVTGEKDAVDAEGKPVYQGIDTSFVVPLLTAALQEAVAKIESLTARIEALEAQA